MPSKVADLFVQIGADMGPLNGALSGLGPKLVAPFSTAMQTTRDMAASGLASVGTIFGDIWNKNLGAAVEGAGKAIGTTLGSTVNQALTFVLGETVGGTIGTFLDKTINFVIGSVSEMAGKLVQGITAPNMAALQPSLTDVEYWVAKVMESEQVLAKFGAISEGVGKQVGYTSEQLLHFAEVLAETTAFSKTTAIEAMTRLMQFDRVRGETFRGALEASAGLAAMFKGDLVQAASSVGRAMNDPATGVRRLQRELGSLTHAQMEHLKQTQQTMGIEAAQAELLALLRSKVQGVENALKSTAEHGILKLAQSWTGMGKSLWEGLLPLVKVATLVAQGVVDAMSMIFKPMGKMMGDDFKDLANLILGFLKDNKSTFAEWGQLISEITLNLFKMGRGALKDLFGMLDPDKTKSFWQAFRDGITEGLDKLSLITADWETMRMAAEVAWAYVRDAALDAVDTIKLKWREWLDWLWEELKAIGQKIADWFKVTLADAAGQAMQGIRDAIKAQFKPITDQLDLDLRPPAEGFIGQHLPTWATRAGDLGIQDFGKRVWEGFYEEWTGKDWETIGKEMGQGIATGVEAGAAGGPEGAAPISEETKARQEQRAEIEKDIAARKAERDIQSDNLNLRMASNRVARDQERDRLAAEAKRKKMIDETAHAPPIQEEMRKLTMTGFEETAKQIQLAITPTKGSVEENTAKTNEELANQTGILLDIAAGIGNMNSGLGVLGQLAGSQVAQYGP